VEDFAMTFGLLHENDIPLLRGIFETDDYFQGFNPNRIKAFLSEKQNIALIAKLDGKIIGLVYGYSLTRMDDVAPQFFIYSVDIHPAYQDKGFGSRFMRYVVDWARDNGFSESFVFTNKDNPRACRVYEKADMTHSESDCERMYEVKYGIENNVCT
jgi:GNAT superfamily N-acetyltransferase